eukprot:UN02822
MYASKFTRVAQRHFASRVNTPTTIVGRRQVLTTPTYFNHPSLALTRKYAPTFTTTTTLASSTFFSSSNKPLPTEEDPIEQQTSPKGSFKSYLAHNGDAESTNWKEQYKEQYGTLQSLEQNQQFKDLDGNLIDLQKITQGKAVLIYNNGCDCGFAKKALANMHNWYTKWGKGNNSYFQIIGVPSNSFNQETKDAAGIKQYMAEHGLPYPTECLLLEKTDVNGTQQHPIYKWLKKLSQV